MKVKGMILAILMAVILLPALASANGTASSTSLTNSVKLFYQDANSNDKTPQTDTAGATVTPTYGYDSSVPTGSSATVSPGSTATFRINITNNANVSDTFTFALDVFDTSGGAVSWSRSLYDSSATNALSSPHTDGAIAEAAETSLVIKITPPGSTADASLGTAYVSVKTNNTPTGHYQGDNGTIYGGYDTHTFIFVTTVGGPVISAVTKTLSVKAPTGYSGGATDPVPGATLRYQIAFQNTGSGTATNVWIYDTFPTAANAIGWANGSRSDSGAAPDTVEWYSGSWGTGEPADNGETATVIRFGFANITPGVSDTVGYNLYIK